MKWLFAVPLGLLGVVLLAVGTTVAVVVGPDDTTYTKTETLGDGSPIVTDPDVLSWERLQLHVRAESDGEVFVGAGNPIDVSDYTADAAHFSVDRIQPLGVSGRDWRGDGLPASPGNVDFWTDHESGSGVQTMSLDIDGEPVQILVAPVGADRAPVDVAFGATIDGLFLWSVVTAGVGVLLLLLALGVIWWSRRRARKRAARAATYPSVPPPPIPPPPAQPPVTDGQHAVRRTRLVAPAAALLLLGTGCSALPQPVAYDEPTKVPLTDENVHPVWDDIDYRMGKAARTAGEPKYRHGAWAQMSTGPMRQQLSYNSRLREYLDEETPGQGWGGYPSAVYAAPQSGYPMRSMVSFRDGSDDRLTVLQRRSAADDWKVRSTVALATMVAEPDQAASPGAEDIEAGAEMVKELRKYWQSGKKPTTVDLREPGKKLHRQLQKMRTRERRKDWIADTRRKLTWDGELTAVPAKRGTLYVAELKLERTLLGTGLLEWEDGYNKLHETVSPSELRQSAFVTVAVIRYEDGGGRVLGAELGFVASKGRGSGGGSADRSA